MSATQFMVITGLSGSGKSLVHSCFEDMGYYCVDNLPISLLGKFFELAQEAAGEITRAAVVTDVREPSFLSDFERTYRELKSRFRVQLLFLEASEEVLIQRFSETRRPHPLALHAPLRDALRLEREKLEPIRELADHVLDTSGFNVHEVREYVKGKFGGGGTGSLIVSLVSFGFKHGIPRDADLLFDVRFLPNPHFLAEFRGKTGQDSAVRDWILAFDDSRTLLGYLGDFLRFLLPRYIKEGKAYLTIAIGCTGGKHRSVTVANELATALKDPRYALTVAHRDLERA